MSKRIKEILSNEDGRKQLGKIIISGCDGVVNINGKKYKITRNVGKFL